MATYLCKMSCHLMISAKCEAACLKNCSIDFNFSVQDGTAADTDAHSSFKSISGEDEDTFMDWQSEESQGNDLARNVVQSPPTTDHETPMEID